MKLKIERTTFISVTTAMLLVPSTHAGTTLNGDHFIAPVAGAPGEAGDLIASGDLGAWGGLGFGSTGGSTPLEAVRHHYIQSGLFSKTAITDITEANGSLLWRDGVALTSRSKMSLDASNVLTLFGTNGSDQNIILNGETGRISIAGTGSGIYSQGTAIFTIGSSSEVVIGDGRNLILESAASSSSSSTGALIITGGAGIAKDSYINGVRVGRGSGNIGNNTALGNAALTLNTTGYHNTAVGDQALANSDTPPYNTAVGSSAMRSTTSGWANTAVGSQALESNTSGHFNSVFGHAAMLYNTTGYQNSAFGTWALRNNTSGIWNTGIGMGSMQYNTTGSGNTSLGYASGLSNTTGGGNTAVGMVSLTSNTTGDHNTAVGNHSANNLSSGSENVMLGASAASVQADGSTPLGTVSRSVYIGAYSRGHSNSDYNSIVIGAGAVGSGANTTVIGTENTTKATIYGTVETSAGLKVGGDTVLEGNTVVEGKITIATPQGDISMGIYE